jgi:RNA polymerase sigma factor (sigma-70 family)
MAEEEALLLARYSRGRDAEAFRALVEAHQHMVFAACHRVLHNQADAEDAAQECFFRLAQKAGQLTAPIAGWLHTVAVQRAIDTLRRRVARRTYEANAAARPADGKPCWEDIRSHVDEAIAALPERLRVPIVLYYLEGRTQEAVARELGISQPAVSGRLKQAVAALRGQLEGAGLDLPAVALAPLLTANAMEAAPATLSAALGKMALAGVGGGAAAGLSVARIAALLAAAAAAVLCVLWAGVWGIRAVLGGPPPGRTVPTPAALPSPAARAAPAAVDRILNGSADGTDMFIDFDTGELSSMPANIAEVQPMVDWMRRTGADAFYNRQMDARSLIGADIAAVRLPDSAWDEVDAGARIPAPPTASGFPVYLESSRSGTATFCVRTREGGLVLVQLVNVGRRGGSGMHIRQKTLRVATDSP